MSWNVALIESGTSSVPPVAVTRVSRHLWPIPAAIADDEVDPSCGFCFALPHALAVVTSRAATDTIAARGLPSCRVMREVSSRPRRNGN